jgi:hypothetical protein
VDGVLRGQIEGYNKQFDYAAEDEM